MIKKSTHNTRQQQQRQRRQPPAATIRNLQNHTFDKQTFEQQPQQQPKHHHIIIIIIIIMKFSKLAILKVAASFFVLSRGSSGTIIVGAVLAEEQNPAPHLRLIHREAPKNKQSEQQVIMASSPQGLVTRQRQLQATQQAAWIQLGADIYGEAECDEFGQSLTLSSDGTVLAVGAYFNDGNGSESGHVRVFKYADSQWTQLGADLDGEAAGDFFGSSASLSSDGTVLAVGASNGSNVKSGYVRVYQFADNAWTQLGTDIDGEAASDRFGDSVTLSSDGTVLAVGAPTNDGNGPDSGHVRVYEFANNAWTQMGVDIDGEAGGTKVSPGDFFGASISLSSDGTVLAVGAPHNDGNRGHVRIYKYANSQWSQRGATIYGDAACDMSGLSVSLSSDGSVLAVGAMNNDGNGSNSGHVRVYQFDNNAWTQLGTDIDGEAADDTSGTSVDLSSDGTVLAVGAKDNDGNGSNSGHVRVYKYTNNIWTQWGPDIDGIAAYDNFGQNLSLSSDGTVLAVGAPSNDGNGGTGWNNGHVRVYQQSTTETPPSAFRRIRISYDSALSLKLPCHFSRESR